jgi:hypothetical protein
MHTQYRMHPRLFQEPMNLNFRNDHFRNPPLRTLLKANQNLTIIFTTNNRKIHQIDEFQERYSIHKLIKCTR